MQKIIELIMIPLFQVTGEECEVYANHPWTMIGFGIVWFVVIVAGIHAINEDINKENDEAVRIAIWLFDGIFFMAFLGSIAPFHLCSFLLIAIPAFILFILLKVIYFIYLAVTEKPYKKANKNEKSTSIKEVQKHTPSIRTKSHDIVRVTQKKPQLQIRTDLHSPEIKKLLKEISNLNSSIISYAKKELADRQAEKIQLELNRYTGFVNNLAETYENLKNVDIDSRQKTAIMRKILKALSSCKDSYRAMFNSIVEMASIDTLGNIDVLENLLAPYLDQGLQISREGAENQK